MEVRLDILLLIVACGVVTLLPRVLPLILLRKMVFPKWYQEWLSYIPVTIMSALVAQEMIPAAGEEWDAVKLLAFAASLLCAVVTRSLFFTVVCGVAVVSAAYYL